MYVKMIDLKPIEQRITDAQAGIDAQQDLLTALSQEAAQHKGAMESITDLDKVDEICDRCEARLREISRETKKAKIRLRALKSALIIAQNELQEAIESNRKELHSLQVVEARKLVHEFNLKSQELSEEYDKVSEFLTRTFATTFKPGKQDGDRFYDYQQISGKDRLPVLIFNEHRKQIEYENAGSLDYKLKNMAHDYTI